MTHVDPHPLIPLHQPFRFTHRPPGSKSLTNRALLLAALADGRSVIYEPLIAVDTQVMIDALQALGITIDIQKDDDSASSCNSIEVVGCGGRFPNGATLQLKNAGTAVRFLTAAVAACGTQPVLLDGNERMRQRPIGELVDLFCQLGADITYENKQGYLPLSIKPATLHPCTLEIGSTTSSQYISGLMLVAHYISSDSIPVVLQMTHPVTSASYVAMTLGLMERFGAAVDVGQGMGSIVVTKGSYKNIEYKVEPDASSATYYLAAAAVTPGAVCTIEGLGKKSLQGDIGFADVLNQMGAGLTFGDDFMTIIGPPKGELSGIDINMSRMPDAAMTLAVVAATAARGETVIRGLHTLQYKETKRLSALQAELSKLGAIVEIEDDEVLVITPCDHRVGNAVAIETYNDHRMAMAFAIAANTHYNDHQITILNPDCVCKTYPEFWDDWAIMLQSTT